MKRREFSKNLILVAAATFCPLVPLSALSPKSTMPFDELPNEVQNKLHSFECDLKQELRSHSAFVEPDELVNKYQRYNYNPTKQKESWSYLTPQETTVTVVKRAGEISIHLNYLPV